MERQRPNMEIERPILEGFANTFIPRWDCYHKQLPDGSYAFKQEPLTLDMVYSHVVGEVTIGAYGLDQQSQAQWVGIDADEEGRLERLKKLYKDLEAIGQPAYLEQSRRGGHFWVFIPKMPGSEARRLGQQLLREYGLGDLLEAKPKIEIYSKQSQLAEGVGSFLRLPFGMHRVTGKRYHFVTTEGEPLAPTIREQLSILADPLRLSQPFISALLALAPEHKPVAPTRAFTALKPGVGEKLSDVLKATISVPDFVGRFVQLDSSGKGHCPFHDDEHASFQVSSDGNFWNCHAGCGGGSIIDFWSRWRQKEGRDGSFAETVKEMREMLIQPTPKKKHRKKGKKRP